MDLIMDTLEYDAYMRELWAVVSMLSVTNLDALLRDARERGNDSDIDLILALRSLKEERHEP